MTADVSELRAFAVELGEVDGKVTRQIDVVVRKGALNIKNAMASDFGSSGWFRQIGPTVNFDVERTSDGVEAEIGPDKRRRAARLANIAYFGGANGGGGTVREPARALEDEVPAFERELGKLVEGIL